LYCAFIEFSKAFDYVDRNSLWLKVKLSNNHSNSFECHLVVRQGQCSSPFLCSMFVNAIEESFIQQGVNGINLNTLKIFLILYVDDIVLFDDLQHNLNVLREYCQKWKLTVNTMKTKVMFFRKDG